MNRTTRHGSQPARRPRSFGTTLMVCPLFLAALAGCGGGPGTARQAAEALIRVNIGTVRLESLPDEIEAPGTVASVRTAQVAARTMGTVQQVLVREGDIVQQGQLLAQLDARELSARRSAAQAALAEATAARAEAAHSLAAAQAQADVARKTYDRFRYLREQKSVSPQEFDEVEAKQHAAQAELEAAQARQQQAEFAHARALSESHAAETVSSYARIVAPFAGVIVRRVVEPGSMAMPGTLLLVVEDTSRYRLEVTVNAADAAGLARGSKARVRLDALPNRKLAGQITEIEAGADPASHTVRVRIELPREAARLGGRSGLFGRAWFRRGERRTIALPRGTVLERGQLRGVYVVDAAGVARWRLVTLGPAAGDRVEILSGLSEGERIVLNPAGLELDGKRVEAKQ